MENYTRNATTSDDFDRVSFPVIVIMRFVSLLVILVNGGVLICLASMKHKLSRVYSLQLVCISFNDFIAGISSLQVSFADSDTISHSFVHCCICLWFFVSCQCATLYNILALCISRLTIIRKITQKDKNWTMKHSAIGMGIAWLTSILLCGVPFLIWTINEDNYQHGGCSMETVFLGNFPYVMRMLGSIFILPLLLTNSLYTVAACLLKRTIKRTSAVSPLPSSIENAIQESEERTKSAARGISCHTQLSRLAEAVEQAHVSNLSQQNTSQMESQETASTSLSVNIAMASFKVWPTVNDGFQPAHGHHSKEKTKVNTCSYADRQSISLSSKAELNQQRADNAKIHKHGKAFLVLCLILVFLNIFTWPAVMVLMSQGLLDGYHLSRSVKFPLFSTIATNSAINPALYAIVVPEFRNALKDMFKALFINFERTCCSRTRVLNIH